MFECYKNKYRKCYYYLNIENCCLKVGFQRGQGVFPSTNPLHVGFSLLPLGFLEWRPSGINGPIDNFFLNDRETLWDQMGYRWET